MVWAGHRADKNRGNLLRVYNCRDVLSITLKWFRLANQLTILLSCWFPVPRAGEAGCRVQYAVQAVAVMSLTQGQWPTITITPPPCPNTGLREREKSRVFET